MNEIFSSEQVISLIKQVITTNNSSSISIHEPDFLNTNALKYVSECIETGWVSSAGSWVHSFDKSI